MAGEFQRGQTWVFVRPLLIDRRLLFAEGVVLVRRHPVSVRVRDQPRRAQMVGVVVHQPTGVLLALARDDAAVRMHEVFNPSPAKLHVAFVDANDPTLEVPHLPARPAVVLQFYADPLVIRRIDESLFLMRCRHCQHRHVQTVVFVRHPAVALDVAGDVVQRTIPAVRLRIDGGESARPEWRRFSAWS